MNGIVLPVFETYGPCSAHSEKYNVFDFLDSSQTRILYVQGHLHTENIHRESSLLRHLSPVHIVALHLVGRLLL